MGNSGWTGSVHWSGETKAMGKEGRNKCMMGKRTGESEDELKRVGKLIMNIAWKECYHIASCQGCCEERPPPQKKRKKIYPELPSYYLKAT